MTLDSDTVNVLDVVKTWKSQKNVSYFEGPEIFTSIAFPDH